MNIDNNIINYVQLVTASCVNTMLLSIKNIIALRNNKNIKYAYGGNR